MSNFVTELNPQQRAAVLHTDGPAVVLAGAGSGKTRVLTTRVARLLAEKKASPDEILVVTFTNKAADEMKSRITAYTGISLLKAGTFHSTAARMLRRDGQHIGLASNFIIYDADDQLKLIRRVFTDLDIDEKRTAPKAVHHTISTAKNELIDPEEYATLAQNQYQQVVAQVYQRYQALLQQAGAVDFDDLLMRLVTLLATHSDVRERYQSQIKYLLVDEYQDTNKAQYVLTKLLGAPQNNIFVVGDFSQSIYSWRGANYRNMLLLQQDFPEISEYQLEQNYRSQQTILSAASQLIAHNTRHPVLSLWSERSQTRPITVYQAATGYEEARYVVDAIRGLRTTLSLSEMAILYRTNAQSRIFEDVLLEKGIPYQIIGGTNFYERKEVKDVLAYAKIVANANDIISHERALSLGKRRFAKFETLNTAELAHLTPAELLQRIVSTTGYLEKYKNKPEELLQRQANIEELISVAAQFEDLIGFLENISLVQNNELRDAAATDQTKDSLSLMSLHTAKGLEFGAVFLVGMEDGLLPHSRSLFDQDQLEEERRLCYVGITRAKEYLYCTAAESRYRYGSPSKSKISRFIKEIDPSLCQFEGGIEAHRTGRRIVPIDDDLMDGVLSGDIDISALIES